MVASGVIAAIAALLIAVRCSSAYLLSSGSHLATSVRAFTDYHLHFRRHYDSHDSFRCERSRNTTEELLDKHIVMCPNDRYRPRRVSRAQISLKSTAAQNTSSAEALRKDSNEKIHQYLIFSLILADHPFSQKMEQTLAQVGPMFPRITIITANAHEFADLATKYLVQSYPKTLFFKAGLFVGDYTGNHEPGDFAAQLYLWTRSLPSSSPAIGSTSIENNTSLSSEAVTFKLPSFLSIPEFTLSLPASNLEPFMGTVINHRLWHHVVFVLSTVYVTVRFEYFVRKLFRNS